MNALVNVALPVFAIILSGYLAGRARLLGTHATESLNLFVFYVALPALLFAAMARTEPAAILNGPFIFVYGLAMATVFLLAVPVAILLFRRPVAEAGVAGMAAIFGNTGYMGIPLTLTAFGPDLLLPAMVATVINSAVVVGGISAMVEGATRGGQGGLVVLGHVLRSLARNPLVLAPLAGLGVAALGLPLPGAVGTYCDIVGGAAGPCALFAIGLFLVGKPLTADLAEVAVMTALKLVALPLVALVLLPMVPGLDRGWAGVLLVMCALPVGANVFVLAMKYETWVAPSASATLLSTLFSVPTVTAVLIWLDV